MLAWKRVEQMTGAGSLVLVFALLGVALGGDDGEGEGDVMMTVVVQYTAIERNKLTNCMVIGKRTKLRPSPTK
jgi:hypothetical protein